MCSRWGSHYTLDGKCVLLEGSAIRLSLIPWLLSLVLPLLMVVEKGGRVAGLIVLMDPFYWAVSVPVF